MIQTLPLLAAAFIFGAGLELHLTLRLRHAWRTKTASEQALLTSIVSFSKPGPLRLGAMDRKVEA